MTPGMGQPMDPRMAQMMQAQKLQGARRMGAVPRESEDTELIQLIKMLTAMGIPMEQLRGRTKEELVEMLVSISGKGKSGTEIIEGEAIEERGGEEVEAAEEEVIQAAHGGRIGMAEGWSPGVGRDERGYQPSHPSHRDAGGPPGITTSPTHIPTVTPKDDGIISKLVGGAHPQFCVFSN